MIFIWYVVTSVISIPSIPGDLVMHNRFGQKNKNFLLHILYQTERSECHQLRPFSCADTIRFQLLVLRVDLILESGKKIKNIGITNFKYWNFDQKLPICKSSLELSENFGIIEYPLDPGAQTTRMINGRLTRLTHENDSPA